MLNRSSQMLIRWADPVLAHLERPAQMNFARELTRVARRVFHSVPCRCPFPVDNHTAIPLLYWCGIAEKGFLDTGEEPHPHDPPVAGVVSTFPRAKPVPGDDCRWGRSVQTFTLS